MSWVHVSTQTRQTKLEYSIFQWILPNLENIYCLKQRKLTYFIIFPSACLILVFVRAKETLKFNYKKIFKEDTLFINKKSAHNCTTRSFIDLLCKIRMVQAIFKRKSFFYISLNHIFDEVDQQRI